MPNPTPAITEQNMNEYGFSFQGHQLLARPDGTLWWPDQGLLVVSDLHLGKSGRMARRGGGLLPPYETRDTLLRLDEALNATNPATVICLGDSFDDATAAEEIGEDEILWLTRMQSGRVWIWIAGNHDPAPLPFPGEQKAEHTLHGLVFRHIAKPEASGEISGHFHPKTRVSSRGKSLTRASFVVDQNRIILPAFGTYTGGMHTDHPALSDLFGEKALAIVTGRSACPVPLNKI